MPHLLEVRDLVTRFHTEDGVVHAVNGISYTLDEGESMGIVGESGSGKTVSVLSLMGLIPDPPGRVERGEVFFADSDLLKLSSDQLRAIRGREIAMIFQDPMTSLNPVLTVGYQLAEIMRPHLNLTREEIAERTIELLEWVGIPNAESRRKDFPHQFSGGQRQRIMIAMSLACNPSVLIADEPTTALDVTIQAQIIDLVNRLREQFGMATIWITHDLGVVAGLVDRVIVMYAGFIVETASALDLYKKTSHPYTLGLLQSIPSIHATIATDRLIPIEGSPPDLLLEPVHCPFAPRCKFAVEKCWQENPPLQRVASDHDAACWRWEDVRAMGASQR